MAILLRVILVASLLFSAPGAAVANVGDGESHDCCPDGVMDMTQGHDLSDTGNPDCRCHTDAACRHGHCSAIGTASLPSALLSPLLTLPANPVVSHGDAACDRHANAPPPPPPKLS